MTEFLVSGQTYIIENIIFNKPSALPAINTTSAVSTTGSKLTWRAVVILTSMIASSYGTLAARVLFFLAREGSRILKDFLSSK